MSEECLDSQAAYPSSWTTLGMKRDAQPTRFMETAPREVATMMTLSRMKTMHVNHLKILVVWLSRMVSLLYFRHAFDIDVASSMSRHERIQLPFNSQPQI